jgi:glycosyltransferase involved in cell wall biosynthesis
MSKIVIDNSNLYVGGGIQVATSFLKDLNQLEQNNFISYFTAIIVIQSYNSAKQIDKSTFSSKFIFYDLDISSQNSILKRTKNVKKIEDEVKPDITFTVFGPSYHKSQNLKLVGFAIPYIVYPDSPFFERLSFKEKIYYKFLSFVKSYAFKKFSDALVFETENAKHIFSDKQSYFKECFTVGNTINEIFFNKDSWLDFGKTHLSSCNILCLTSNYPHKNMNIIPKVIDAIKNKFNFYDFKFLITLEKDDLKFNNRYDSNIEYLGKIDLQKIPSLYNLCDIVFIPTLLEVFSATYLEAMLMKKPIVASDLGFSRDICGDAAIFCDPLNSEEYAKAIVDIVNNTQLSINLVNKGTENIKRFGTSMDRTNSYIRIINKLIENNNENTK